jgi:hypothetical protein
MIRKMFKAAGRWCHRMADRMSDNEIKLSKDPRSVNSNHNVDFTVHYAQGGVVVELSHYDRKTDVLHRSLHVVHDSDDLGQHLSQLIMLERLQNG